MNVNRDPLQAMRERYAMCVHTWRVMRLDDNGNTFIVATKLEEGAARERVDELQRRGHKQTYWCEPEDPATVGP
jgi:hypothetical protein